MSGWLRLTIYSVNFNASVGAFWLWELWPTTTLYVPSRLLPLHRIKIRIKCAAPNGLILLYTSSLLPKQAITSPCHILSANTQIWAIWIQGFQSLLFECMPYTNKGHNTGVSFFAFLRKGRPIDFFSHTVSWSNTNFSPSLSLFWNLFLQVHDTMPTQSAVRPQAYSIIIALKAL